MKSRQPSVFGGKHMKENSNLQLVYTPSEVQALLGIGRSKTYQYLAQVHIAGEPFRVLKVGNQYRVVKKSFDEWMCGTS